MKIPVTSIQRKARIEIIPLIDIIFFLLATFVMVSLSMVKNQGVQVNLPSASSSAPQDRQKTVTVTVTERGVFYLDKQELPLDKIIVRLKMLKVQDQQLGVIINGDQKASFGDAIGALDEIRQAGITKVTVQTKAKTSTGGQ